MNNTAAPTVRLEIRESLAFLSLARPDAANTMNLEFGREFFAAALAIEAAPAVRAVVLTGQGKNFCFGGDLKGMVASGADVRAYLSELTTNLHAGMALLARLDAPVIAAVNGTAAGAGLGLVLAADLAIAARSAKFAPAYTGVGLTPDAGCTFLLPRAVGYKRAMDLLLTNRMLDAQQALDWGLVNQVVEDESRSLVIEKRGTPKAVLLSIRDYVKLAAPEPEVLRVLGEESKRKGGPCSVREDVSTRLLHQRMEGWSAE